MFADSLRIFYQGTKVGVEIAIMATEHGFITPDAGSRLLAFGKNFSLNGKIREKTNFVYPMPILVITRHVFDSPFSEYPKK